MGFFSRKDKIVDLTEDYKYEKKHPKEDLKIPSPTSAPLESQESSSGGFFNFFGSSNTPSSSTSSSSTSIASSSGSSLEDSTSEETIDAGEKRRRLAKRLKDMTDRIEEQSNQIYQLQQRIDLLERKMRYNSPSGNSD